LLIQKAVLANGSISNISYQTHPELYFAFRGGGNQFGIVTRFDLATFPQGLVWGGHSYYFLDDVPRRKKSMKIKDTFRWSLGGLIEKALSWTTQTMCWFGYCSSVSDLLKQFGDFAETTDPVGQIILSFAFVPYNINTWVACLSRLYGEPEANPTVFKGFESQDNKSFYTTNRITNLTGINAEVDWMNQVGFR
jgi:hypothetical protein